MKLFTEYKCVHCGYGIYSENVYQYSNHLYGLTLCLKCQKIFQNNKSTMESRILYKALRERNVPVELEVFDGHKTIDLVVKSLKINIEVDGVHHNANSKQASSDLIRTLCSYRKGYITFRIPNSIIHNSLEETADRIVDILLEAKNRKDERDSSFKDLPEKEYNHKKFSFFRVLEGIYKRIF